MTNESVLYRRHDSIVTLTLNRPETLNAMNEAMMGEIERILIELEADAPACIWRTRAASPRPWRHSSPATR